MKRGEINFAPFYFKNIFSFFRIKFMIIKFYNEYGSIYSNHILSFYII